MYKNKLIKIIATTSIFISGIAFAGMEDLTKPEYVNDISYYIGINTAKTIKHDFEGSKNLIHFNTDKFIDGFIAEMKSTHKLTDKAINDKVQAFAEILSQAAKVKSAEIAKVNEQEGKKFRDNYEKQSDVKKTASGILYRIKNPGTGAALKSTDSIKIQHHGALINGRIFEATAENGSTVLPLQKTFPAWREAVSLIKKGGEIEFVVPPELAFGDAGTKSIPSKATLIFNVKILDIVKP